MESKATTQRACMRPPPQGTHTHTRTHVCTIISRSLSVSHTHTHAFTPPLKTQKTNRSWSRTSGRRGRSSGAGGVCSSRRRRLWCVSCRVSFVVVCFHYKQCVGFMCVDAGGWWCVCVCVGACWRGGRSRRKEKKALLCVCVQNGTHHTYVCMWLGVYAYGWVCVCKCERECVWMHLRRRRRQAPNLSPSHKVRYTPNPTQNQTQHKPTQHIPNQPGRHLRGRWG
jgi:hypothetical protein